MVEKRAHTHCVYVYMTEHTMQLSLWWTAGLVRFMNKRNRKFCMGLQRHLIALRFNHPASKGIYKHSHSFLSSIKHFNSLITQMKPSFPHHTQSETDLKINQSQRPDKRLTQTQPPPPSSWPISICTDSWWLLAICGLAVHGVQAVRAAKWSGKNYPTNKSNWGFLHLSSHYTKAIFPSLVRTYTF